MTAAPLPSAARGLSLFIATVVVAGGTVIAHSLYRLPQVPDPSSWLLLSVLAVLSATCSLKVPGVPAYLSISDAFFIAIGLLFGPSAAALTIAVDSLIVSVRRKGRSCELLFNVTSSALALWSGVQAQVYLSGGEALAITARPPDADTVLPLFCLAAIYFLINSGLTATAVALSKGLSPVRFWLEHFAVMSVNYFAAASAALLLLPLVHFLGMGALALVTPLILVCYVAMRSWLGRLADAQQHLRDMNRLHLSTIAAFSTAIEAKDGVTSDHIHRVQAYAMGLARALDITDEPTLKALEAAALLHDTGKLAIPEHILNKPGKLTAAEFETMKAHVDIGADILSSIDFPFPVVPIVRAHHENWNGKGYPQGLRGEEIPIGARILSVVDCFDALTSDRPYHRAMSDTAAVELIVQNRGTMYDPRVVDTFARVYREIAPKSLPEPRLHAALSRIRGAVASGGAARRPVEAQRRQTQAQAPTTELLAFVSLARLASGTPTIADLGALADGYLRHVAPDATMALFVVDTGRDSIALRFASGRDAAALTGLTIRLGERVSGWAAANGVPMANAEAQLELLDATPAGLLVATATPLVADGELVGVLTLYDEKPFCADQARTLEMIAPQLALAVASIERAAVTAQRRGQLRVVGGR